ncbi:secretin receptor-like protein, partial [Leptotrombidium deliense]
MTLKLQRSLIDFALKTVFGSLKKKLTKVGPITQTAKLFTKIRPFRYLRHVGNIKLITKIGYSVSLITLVIAFFILTFNKRLQCPRNNLHLQLFLSFIIRSSVFHVKNTLVCKMFTVVWQYSLLANYNWILMEGLYLHNLIFFNIFTDNSSIIKYIIFGLPIMYISPWIVVKALYENKLCWTTNDNVGYFWIIRGPITLSII